MMLLPPKMNFLTRSNASSLRKMIYSLFFLVGLLVAQALNQLLFLSFHTKENSNVMETYDNALIASSSIVYIVFIGTLREELAFRLALTPFKLNYVRISVSLVLAGILTIISSFFLLKIEISQMLLEGCFAILIFVTTLLLRIDFSSLAKAWDQNLNVIVWISILTFCLVHVPQLISFGFNFLTIVRATISFGLCAFVYTVTRIRYGFFYGWVIHCIYNYITIS